MFFLGQPSQQQVAQFLAKQESAPFSYAEVGQTANPEAPPGYTVDRYSIELGKGPEIYERAVAAVRRWKMFDQGWITIADDSTPIEAGRCVAVRAYHLGFWSLNACKIVYVVDESDERHARFGFAYGTLRDHSEVGEELFTVEWNKLTDAVTYDIYAFSQPAQLIAKIGYIFSRACQKRFGAESKKAMLRAVTATYR